jgi:purine-cytosine permease-like protein
MPTRDSTGPQQMWIWAGANIAPINWALGALGIVLKLGLWETVAVIVLGNLVGCAIFAAFTVMGHKTGVNQMVLSRSAFGRRGAYPPSALIFLMTLGWIGVNTYFPVKIAMAILGQFGISDTYLVTIYFIIAPSFAKAFDNWMISLLLWMSPFAGVVLADFFIKRKGSIDVAELYREPDTSAYGDINWSGMTAFLVGLIAGWSVEDGLVPALQGPISTGLLGGADLSWLVGILVSGAVYLALGERGVAPLRKGYNRPIDVR